MRKLIMTFALAALSIAAYAQNIHIGDEIPASAAAILKPRLEQMLKDGGLADVSLNVTAVVKEKTEVASGVVLHSEEREGIVVGNDCLLYADPTDNPRVNNCQLFVGMLYPNGVSQTEKKLFPQPSSGNDGHLLGIKNDYRGEPYTYYFGSAWSKYDIRTMDEWQARANWTLRSLKTPLKAELK